MYNNIFFFTVTNINYSLDETEKCFEPSTSTDFLSQPKNIQKPSKKFLIFYILYLKLL